MAAWRLQASSLTAESPSNMFREYKWQPDRKNWGRVKPIDPLLLLESLNAVSSHNNWSWLMFRQTVQFTVSAAAPSSTWSIITCFWLSHYPCASVDLPGDASALVPVDRGPEDFNPRNPPGRGTEIHLQEPSRRYAHNLSFHQFLRESPVEPFDNLKSLSLSCMPNAA